MESERDPQVQSVQAGPLGLGVPLAREGLPVRDAQGRQIGHVLSVREDPVGLFVHVHLSDPPLHVRHVVPAPLWVRGRRVRLGFPAP